MKAEMFGLKKNQIFLKQNLDTKGYYQVMLWNGPKYKAFRIHRLIAEYYIPNPKNYPIINHKDGNKTNNKISNLEWCTNGHNIKHAHNMGLIKLKTGIEKGINKLTEEQVLEIRKMREDGAVYREIKAKFKIAHSTAWNICNRKKWKHI